MQGDPRLLPFNCELLGEGFRSLTPDAVDDGAPGLWVILHGDTVLLTAAGQLPDVELGDVQGVIVGDWDGRRVRAVRLPDSAVPPAGLVGRPLRAWLGEIEDPRTLTVAGLGAQILHWEAHTSLCSKCGSTDMTYYPGTRGKTCSSCGWAHYPLVLPCTIVLVRRGAEFLLGRGIGWPEDRYSLIAGFVDMGESLDACAAREVQEETGIVVANVRYVASQSWPFPAQLMIGFVADYADGEIRVDEAELEDARWFTPATLPALPPVGTISRFIIDRYALKSA